MPTYQVPFVLQCLNSGVTRLRDRPKLVTPETIDLKLSLVAPSGISAPFRSFDNPTIIGTYQHSIFNPCRLRSLTTILCDVPLSILGINHATILWCPTLNVLAQHPPQQDLRQSLPPFPWFRFPFISFWTTAHISRSSLSAGSTALPPLTQPNIQKLFMIWTPCLVFQSQSAVPPTIPRRKVNWGITAPTKPRFIPSTFTLLVLSFL